MKIHNKIINGVKIKAYNDSNAEWVIQVEGSEIVHRFDKRKWSMKQAVEFAAKITG